MVEVPATEQQPIPLEHVGRTFIKKKYGVVTAVILKEIAKRKVTLGYPEREDTFKIPIEEFQKYYKITSK